ncbi:hypothetical protein C5167_015193 [Papaver somniferum]|uniref:Uncharacterized protein n=1 Tax=Papaver somniferum TaxID=3469 RepID=A0A4Y7J9F5_PAPSO|nr:hypothetical protein C5167_015193 [Papaver somniferum]
MIFSQTMQERKSESHPLGDVLLRADYNVKEYVNSPWANVVAVDLAFVDKCQGKYTKTAREVDRVYLSTPTKIAIIDHEKRRTFVLRKESMPDAVGTIGSLEEKTRRWWRLKLIMVIPGSGADEECFGLLQSKNEVATVIRMESTYRALIVSGNAKHQIITNCHFVLPSITEVKIQVTNHLYLFLFFCFPFSF